MDSNEQPVEEQQSQAQGCPMGIPAKLLRKMTSEAIAEWSRNDWLTSSSKDTSTPQTPPA